MQVASFATHAEVLRSFPFDPLCILYCHWLRGLQIEYAPCLSLRLCSFLLTSFSAPVTCLHALRCMSSQGSSAGEQQDWSKAIVAGAVAVGVAGLIYYKKSNGDKESTPQRKEVVGN